MAMSEPTAKPPREKLSLGTVQWRALRLRCPRCGGGKLFRNGFQMYSHCPNCKLQYERAPGYFLGSAYINYGITAVLLTVMYMLLHFGFGYGNRALAGPLAAFCIVFPLFFFRYARAWWLAMDCYFDVTGFEREEQQ